MKALFLTIVLVLNSLNINAKVCNNTNESLDTSMINYVLKVLDLHNISIIVNEKEFNPSLWNYEDSYASCEQLNDSVYSINIKTYLQIYRFNTTIIHELVHIKQMRNKELKKGKTYVWYKGTVYTKSTPYEELPFEIVAMNTAKKLYDDYKKETRK